MGVYKIIQQNVIAHKDEPLGEVPRLLWEVGEDTRIKCNN